MLTAGLAAAAVTLATAPLVLAFLRRRRLLDHPNERSSHTTPTPRGGGIAVAAGCLAAVAAAATAATPDLTGDARTAILLAAVAFGLIGLADDLGELSPYIRLATQLAAAAATAPWLLRDLTGPGLWQLAFAVGTVLWLVSYVNAFNFMDGINGISAAQAIVAGGAWWVIGRSQDADALAAAGLIAAAAAAAFLPFNFPHARMFLGDVGSYFLGAWLAAAAVVGLRSGVAFEATFAPLALYLADTASTIVRRVRRSDPWHTAHRDHAYQRLTALGWTHARTTTALTATMSVCATLGAVSLTGNLAARVTADAALATVLVAYLAAPTWLSRPRTLEAAA